MLNITVNILVILCFKKRFIKLLLFGYQKRNVLNCTMADSSNLSDLRYFTTLFDLKFQSNSNRSYS